MTDRNLLEDFWTLFDFVDNTNTLSRLPEDLATMRAYWGPRETREPWGVCVLLTRGNMVLVVHGPKGISLPGGKPDKGETPRAAGRRELLEETGTFAPEQALVLESTNPVAADNGVPTFLLVEDTERRGPDRMPIIYDGFESEEGVTYWAHPKVLVGKHARFPQYNRKMLTKMGLL